MADAKVHDPTSRKMDKDYAKSDVEHLMRVRDWSGWDELVDWLRREGDNDNELTPGEASHLADDFARLRQAGEPFTRDPDTLFDRAKASR